MLNAHLVHINARRRSAAAWHAPCCRVSAIPRPERLMGHGGTRQSRTRACHQALWRDGRGRRDRPARARRRLLLPARPVGLRQDLDAAHDRRPRKRQRRRHPDRRGQRHRPAARQARHGDDVPELRAVPASELPRQCRLLAEDARRRQGDAARDRRWSSSSSSRWRPYAAARARAAVRRPAAARRAGARAHHPSADPAARRAAFGARSFPARAHARRVAAPAAAGSAFPSSTSRTARTRRSRSPISSW